MASKTACLSRKGYIAFGHQNIQEERSGHHLVGYKAMDQNTISPAEMKLHHASSRRAIEGKHKRASPCVCREPSEVSGRHEKEM